MTTAKKSIEQRAAGIAQRIRSVSLGSGVEAVERAFVEAIVDLVNEATEGRPKPVMPLRYEENVLPYDGEVWGIFHLEGDSDPVALFTTEAEARLDMERRQKLDTEDDDWLSSMDVGVLRGEAAIHFWNSYDPDPRAAPEKPALTLVPSAPSSAS
jgi:hypothetical protein